MLRILLCCSAGMSTSLLVSKMETAARNSGLEAKIEAMPVGEGKQKINDWDVVLLGPQVTYALAEFKAITNKPVSTIPPAIYATAKGKEAVEMAVKMATEAGIQI
ncbi:PTS sugar transporter subunit IIB [Mesoplasma florum]|uniref:PTS sugar transporter subunit IIB n=1 Tax=Mesoplasma florum TaxID=2151 RepID=UPI000D03BEC5|nr:PTS sugar transporter subunit IIB [Mesoplasma florum]AVN58902.1 PTS sugar transporter subunit IIB [Mesoplasma florum]